MTVSGLRMSKEKRQSTQTWDSQAHKKSIGSDQFRPLHRATQDTELVPERKVFQLQGGSRFEARRCGGGQEMKQA